MYKTAEFSVKIQFYKKHQIKNIKSVGKIAVSCLMCSTLLIFLQSYQWLSC